MATAPNMRTWNTGDIVRASYFNENIRDAQLYLLNRPRVKVYSTTGVASGPGEVLATWNTAIFDTDGCFSGSSGSPDSKLTCHTTGVYEIILHIDWQALNDSNGATRMASIQLNNSGGTTMATSAELACDKEYIHPNDGAGIQTNHIVIQHYLTAGDYIEAVVRNTSTTSRSTVNGTDAKQTFFAMRWIGAA